MDGIDIHMQVQRVEYQKLREMYPAQMRKYWALDDACQALMKGGMRRLQLMARAYHWVLNLRGMIADQAGSENK